MKSVVLIGSYIQLHFKILPSTSPDGKLTVDLSVLRTFEFSGAISVSNLPEENGCEGISGQIKN
ncbi:MAG: hypothetical protein U0T81_01070 [Saprospiraceae bacterium]